MIKKFFTAGIVLFFLAILIIPSVTHAQRPGCTLAPDTGQEICANGSGGVTTSGGRAGTNAENAEASSWGDYIFGGIAKGVGQALMSFSAGILAIVGVFFDTVIKVTIIDMATNIGNPQGLGGSITSVWATLRDISNMAFIFVLLFTAFKAMFELNFGSVSTTIRNIIIVALFINFSLFGTKVVIDASNIVAIGFYNSIRTGNSAQFNPGTGAGGPINFQGISGGYMRLIGLQSWFSSGILGSGNGLDAPQILLIGLMSSIFMFVTAIIFLISGVMFLSRFIILILVMVTAAPACVCYIIPGQKGHFDKWVETLKSQAAFAPIFFAMTWVTFRLASSPQFLGTLTLSSVTGAAGPVKDFTNIISQSPSSVSSAGLVLNFMIVMGLAVASLVFSKSVASKAAGFTTISGAVGTVGAGALAIGGRKTFGYLGNKISNSAQGALGSGNFIKRTAARAFTYGGDKLASSTFDIRNAKIPTNVIGEAIQGTIGRTGFGKKIGLNDVNIPAIAIGAGLAGGLIGEAGKKGYRETAAESKKRVDEIEAKEKAAIRVAKTQKAIEAGKDAKPGTPEYIAMEENLAKLSDKETEALVASNKELLKSQNFANMISVKQLEAITKSEQFSEAQKTDFKGVRFKDIDDAMKVGTPAAIGSIRTKIRDLSDSEIEMLNTSYLKNSEFVSHMKSGQIESINKSSRFATSHRNSLKEARRAPLKAAWIAGDRAFAAGATAAFDAEVNEAKRIVKGLGHKEIASLDLADLQRPTMLKVYNPNLLKRMVDEMNPADVPILRADIIANGDPATQHWFTTSDSDKFS